MNGPRDDIDTESDDTKTPEAGLHTLEIKEYNAIEETLKQIEQEIVRCRKPNEKQENTDKVEERLP